METAAKPRCLTHFGQRAVSIALPTPNAKLTSEHAPRPLVSDTCNFGVCFGQQRGAFFSRSHHPKMFRECCAFKPFDWDCTSVHTWVHSCSISTSKSGPIPSVSNTFDLETCFAAQPRAFFPTSQLSKKLRARGCFSILTSKSSSTATAYNFSFLIWLKGVAFWSIRSSGLPR